VEDDAGKIDLNNSPLRLLNVLLQQVGLPPPRAATLAAAIQDYHSSSLEPEPGGAKAAEYQAAGLPYGPSRIAFRSLDELRVVLGMTPEIFARVAPYVSALKTTGIDLAKADPVVQHAVTAAAAGGAMPRVVLDPTGPVTVELYGRAVSGGAGAARHATIRLAFPEQPGDALFRLLSWD
jgi:general secretion pathway protein K